MTTEELKKLAEIAGLVMLENYYGQAYYSAGEYLCQVDGWQPHLRIEQAMMVAEAFPQWEIGKYKFDDLPVIYECILTIEDEELYEQAGTPALAICAAALAAKEG